MKIKKNSFLYGITVLISSQFLIKLIGLFYKIYLANNRFFGDRGNAIYNSAFQFYTFLLMLVSVGIPSCIAKITSEKIAVKDLINLKKTMKIVFSIFFIISFFLSGAMFLLSDFIAKRILDVPEASFSIKLFAPSLFFVTMNSIYRGYFNGLKKMKIYAKSQIIEQFFKTFFAFCFVEVICNYYFYYNSPAYLSGFVAFAVTISSVISLIYLVICYKKSEMIFVLKENSCEENTYSIIRKVLQFVVPITFIAILGGINKMIDSVTVIRGLKKIMSIEGAKIQYGILTGKIDTLILLPLAFNSAFSIELVPLISEAKMINQIDNVKGKIKKSLLVSCVIGFIFFVAYFVFAELIMNILFPNSDSGVILLRISAISTFFLMANQTLLGVFQGLSMFKVSILGLLLGGIIKIIFNVYFISIPNFFYGGINGAAIGNIMSYMAIFIVNMVFIKKYKILSKKEGKRGIM